MTPFFLQRTTEFIRSIDKPETVLVLFDAGKGNEFVDFALKPITEYLMYNTQHMTIRVGGNANVLAYTILHKGLNSLSSIQNPERFEFYFEKSRDGENWGKMHYMNQLDFTSDAQLVDACIKYHWKDAYKEGFIPSLIESGQWKLEEKGLTSVADYIQLKGFALAGIRPATHVMFDLYRVYPRQLYLVAESIVKHCYVSSHFRLTRAIRLHPDLVHQAESLLWDI